MSNLDKLYKEAQQHQSSLPDFDDILKAVQAYGIKDPVHSKNVAQGAWDRLLERGGEGDPLDLDGAIYDADEAYFG